MIRGLFRVAEVGALGVGLCVAGCASAPAPRPTVDLQQRYVEDTKRMEHQLDRDRFQQDMQLSPDVPGWYNEREKLALALGDRTLDKSFDDTFEAMITALANLGCRVNNTERVSGFITSTLPELPPELAEHLTREAREQYAQARRYSPDVLPPISMVSIVTPGAASQHPPQMQLSERLNTGVTLTLARAGNAQTKVKMRFNGVYYPRKVEELYKRVWEAVDKQLFLNRTRG